MNSILLEAKSFSLPITPEPFEKYFSGFEFEYLPFDNSAFNDPFNGKELHGYYDHKNGKVRILYAANCPRTRQRFTQVHELIHFYQHLDQDFLADIEALKSPVMQHKLIERIADKTAAYYLVPLPLLRAEAMEKPNVLSLAGVFAVSPKVIEICLKDYNLTLKEQEYEPPW
jgi:Zn-dependent peptidase ImmA (M78 family)